MKALQDFNWKKDQKKKKKKKKKKSIKTDDMMEEVECGLVKEDRKKEGRLTML